MEAQAKAKFLRTSPLKMRRVLNEIKGRNVEDALNYLHFSPKRSFANSFKTPGYRSSK